VCFLDTLPPKQCRQVTRKIIMLMVDPLSTDAERLKGFDCSRVMAWGVPRHPRCPRRRAACHHDRKAQRRRGGAKAWAEVD